MRALPWLLALTACAPDDAVAWREVFADLPILVPAESAPRTWRVRLEANEAADRSGPTVAHLRADILALAEPVEPFTRTEIAIWLHGDHDEGLSPVFHGPTTQVLTLRDLREVSCSLGDACAWVFDLEVAWVDGPVDVGLDIDLRGFLALGPAREVDRDATLTLEIEPLPISDRSAGP